MAQVDRTDGLTGMRGIKDPVKSVAIAAITLSGEQTVNGTAVVTGDRVLATAQTSSVDNGIYVVATGTWVRAKDFNGTKDITVGTLVVAEDGSQYRVATSGVIGTDAITFEHVSWQSNYDIVLTVSGVPSASLIMGPVPIIRAITFAVDLALSRGVAVVAATSQTVFSIQKNGVEFATATFAAGSTTATFVCAVPPGFTNTSDLRVVAPATPDATLSGVGFTFAAQAA